MKKNNLKKLLLLGVPLGIIYSCSPPKAITESGKVVTKNQVRGGVNYSVNVSTSPIDETIKGVEEFKQMGDKDSFQLTEGLQHINAAALAYCLDPIGYKTDFYLRYGLGHNILINILIIKECMVVLVCNTDGRVIISEERILSRFRKYSI
ncbi:MAG: hypothetical protein K0S44_862 [Bacteroidetes bacterium]|nr:hypothetical protein [Bacteroidota bacterium]